MQQAGVVDGWYVAARSRAVAAGRRRRSAEASTAWPELAPPVGLASGPLGAVQAADREIARQTARRARAVAAFATDRPASADRAQGEPGAMSAERWAARPEVLRGVSEWAAHELTVALSISTQAAEALLTRSITLVQRLPGTLAALEAGALHPGHLWSMLERVAPITDDRVRAEVEAEILRWAAGRVVTPAQLNAKVRREVARRDVRSAARDLTRAMARRGVHLRPDVVDGMASVTVVATMPEAQALYRALSGCAEALAEDETDTRTRGQKMVDCLLDLVLRPGETDVPPVQVLLTVVASLATLAGGDEPGEVDGQLVPAEMVRHLLASLAGMHPAPERPAPEHPAPEHPAPDASTAAPRQAADARTDPEPPGQLCWQAAEQAELEAWWAETERRLLSGELVDPDPDGWGDLVEDLAGLDDLEHPQALGGDAPVGTTGRTDPVAPPDARVPDRWWSDADDAVEAAGLALFRAGGELTRARRLVRAAIRADAADEAAWRGGPPGRVSEAEDALSALREASDEQREWLADLLSATAGGGLVERPRIALTDALSGSLLALTDLPGLRRAGTCGRRACRRHPSSCSHDLSERPTLGPPGPSAGYRPGRELDRWVRARDRRCRFPGCRRRVPRGGELDHHRPYPDGPTSAANLAGYCTGHHRGKHQALGWRHDLSADGTLTVTTPSGLVATSAPPPY
ncbi:HNH endonuclease [Blastococcus sp. TF02-8]|uniref:HNH endonuclease n=1 Tax=Blastococcus sp. TF02-8 TaxID=2250574 RepID=UPI000DE9F9B7|nr:HNH endonuclease [Blastococcus sp. TF02-8]RBY95587.1 HNH endonuclease [Blastococcus sp. TF02-8]